MIRKNVMKTLIILLVIIGIITIPMNSEGWKNPCRSDDPENPENDGTHDWIAMYAWDWLPDYEREYIEEFIEYYQWGTEIPDHHPHYLKTKDDKEFEDEDGDFDQDKWDAELEKRLLWNNTKRDGIDIQGEYNQYHHVYFKENGELIEEEVCNHADDAAEAAQDEYDKAVDAIRDGNHELAVIYMGAIAHYIGDLAVFGHVMGKPTKDWWGNEADVEGLHKGYETWIQEYTHWFDFDWPFGSSNNFDDSMEYDGEIRLISAYDAAIEMARDTTFDDPDIEGDLDCVWMYQTYKVIFENPEYLIYSAIFNHSNESLYQDYLDLLDRSKELINKASNLITEVLYSIFVTVAVEETGEIIDDVNCNSSFSSFTMIALLAVYFPIYVKKSKPI